MPREDILTLVDQCQLVSHLLFEDLRQLSCHDIVTREESSDAVFFSLINRRKVHPKGDPPVLLAELGPNDLITDPDLNLWQGQEKALKRADHLISIYDQDKLALPPPIWLRLLPSCLRISDALVHSTSKAQLRFVSFALEPHSVIDRSGSYGVFVNVNSNAPRDSFPRIERASGLESQSLNRFLFGSYNTLGQKGDILPYVSWGIRFRTNGLPTAASDTLYWLDVHAQTSSTQDFCRSRLNPEDKLSARISFPRFPGRFDNRALEKAIEGFLRDWLFDAFPRNERLTVPLSTPSDQTFAYVALNSTSFPEGKYPSSRGMDCLICPGPFLSVKTLLWGTGMTISYGFEGEVPLEAANRLLNLTQTLMIAPTMAAQADKVRTRSSDIWMENWLHQARQDLLTIDRHVMRHRDNVQTGFATFLPQIPHKDKARFEELFRPFSQPVSFLWLQMIAGNGATIEMPLQYVEALKKPWDSAFAATLAESLVKPWVLARVEKALDSKEERGLRRKIAGTPFPTIKVMKPILVSKPTGLLLALVLSLRNACQHAWLHAIRTAESEIANVNIEKAATEAPGNEIIHITNSGAPPSEPPLPQYGWKRDVELIAGFKCFHWQITCCDKDRHQYSRWIPEANFWLTEVYSHNSDDT